MEIIYLYLIITWLMGIGFTIDFDSENGEGRPIWERIVACLIIIIISPIIVPIRWGIVLCK